MINMMGNNTSFYYLKALMPSICYDGVKLCMSMILVTNNLTNEDL